MEDTDKKMEKTCLVIKPDGIGKKVAGKIIDRLETEGLKLIAMKMFRPDRPLVEKFYSIHKDRDFFVPLVEFILTGPLIVSVWEGENAVRRVRKIIGSTHSKSAEPGTLRKLYGTDGTRNLVHAADSVENAVREIEFFFSMSELINYDEHDWELAVPSELYRKQK